MLINHISFQRKTPQQSFSCKAALVWFYFSLSSIQIRRYFLFCLSLDVGSLRWLWRSKDNALRQRTFQRKETQFRKWSCLCSVKCCVLWIVIVFCKETTKKCSMCSLAKGNAWTKAYWASLATKYKIVLKVVHQIVSLVWIRKAQRSHLGPDSSRRLLLFSVSTIDLLQRLCLQKYKLVHLSILSDVIGGKVYFGERRRQRVRSQKTHRGWGVFRSPIFISAAQFVILLSLLPHGFVWELGKDILYQYCIDGAGSEDLRPDIVLYKSCSFNYVLSRALKLLFRSTVSTQPVCPLYTYHIANTFLICHIQMSTYFWPRYVRAM